LAEARGEYFVYCSDDDTLAPWILEKCVAVAAQDPQMPIVMGLCDFYLATEGYVDRAAPSTKLSTGIWRGTQLLIEYLRNEITVGNCSMIIRTEALRARGGLPTDVPSWGADVAGWAPLLMKGNAGFVNEACATYCVHNASESSQLSFEGRLRGERELTNCIVRMANSIIEDADERRRVQWESKLYLARRVVFTLAQHRKRGDKLAEVLPWLWHWRREISYIGVPNPLNFVKPIALVLFPKSIADQIRQLKQFL
jgi:hypothetical protein